MNRRLFWKLCGVVAVGTLVLFWTITFLGNETEQKMSFIEPEHQQSLLAWGRRAEELYQSGDMAALERWLEKLQEQENTWAAVVRSGIEPLAGSRLSAQFLEGFRLGRNVEWKIHLYFPDNPIMDITFADGHTHFLVTLPQRMRPGVYLAPANVFLKLALPLTVLMLLSWVLYRHLTIPLRQLELATRQFSEGNLGVRVRAMLGRRNDELAALATTFDGMAEHTGELILNQRRLIADLSHELRTPLTRIDMAVSCAEEGVDTAHFLPRIRRECAHMRALVEDTLTLAWLENEQPGLDQESLDLTELLDSIIEDARYEYSQHLLRVTLPDQSPITGSSHRALAQAIENIVRNALSYTPPGGTVTIDCHGSDNGYLLRVADQGPGVPADQLELIFRPFYRTAAARADRPDGHGLGLALARRQVLGAGGWLRAENGPDGLVMLLWLPSARS